jgi:hypothetical protein
MVDEFHFSRVVCVVEGFEDGFSNVDKRGRERPWSATAIPCPSLECAEFSNQVDVHFVLRSPCSYEQFIPRDFYCCIHAISLSVDEWPRHYR